MHCGLLIVENLKPAGEQTISALRIGIISPDLSNNHGAAHYSLNLLLALQRAGVQMTILAPHNTPHAPDLSYSPILPQITPRERPLILRLIRAAPGVAARLRDCDVVHAAAEHYSVLGHWIAGSRPLFTNVHGTYACIDRMHRWPSSALYHRAMRRSTLLCLSNYTAGVVRANFGLHLEQAPVVNPGIDARRFANLPPLKTPKRGPTVLTAGGVKLRKGTLELIHAVAKVRAYVPDVQCVILGSINSEPEYIQRVRAAIQELRLEDCVHLPGFVDEETLLAWYGAADVFVLPSVNRGYRFEGFGLVHLEASAAGLPVIGATGCGVEDAIDEGVTGLLVPQNDLAEALPQAIIDVLTNPQRAAQMGAVGREKAQAQTWDKTAQQVIGLYDGVLRAR